MTATVFPYAYPYVEYNDDPDITAWFKAYNTQGQSNLDSFNALQLPIYSGQNLTGALLDWSLTNLYGLRRPALPAGSEYIIGPYGTAYYGQVSYGVRKTLSTGTFYDTTDDIYKRVATWPLWKGDGRVFNIRWLKRRVMRFLTGVNGTAGQTDQTYQVSVTISGTTVTIRLFSVFRSITGGAIYGRFSYGTKSYGLVDTVAVTFPTQTLGPILQSAIVSGVLELPFQFNFVVTTS